MAHAVTTVAPRQVDELSRYPTVSRRIRRIRALGVQASISPSRPMPKAIRAGSTAGRRRDRRRCTPRERRRSDRPIERGRDRLDLAATRPELELAAAVHPNPGALAVVDTFHQTRGRGESRRLDVAPARLGQPAADRASECTGASNDMRWKLSAITERHFGTEHRILDHHVGEGAWRRPRRTPGIVRQPIPLPRVVALQVDDPHAAGRRQPRHVVRGPVGARVELELQTGISRPEAPAGRRSAMRRTEPGAASRPSAAEKLRPCLAQREVQERALVRPAPVVTRLGNRRRHRKEVRPVEHRTPLAQAPPPTQRGKVHPLMRILIRSGVGHILAAPVSPRPPIATTVETRTHRTVSNSSRSNASRSTSASSVARRSKSPAIPPTLPLGSIGCLAMPRTGVEDVEPHGRPRTNPDRRDGAVPVPDKGYGRGVHTLRSIMKRRRVVFGSAIAACLGAAIFAGAGLNGSPAASGGRPATAAEARAIATAYRSSPWERSIWCRVRTIASSGFACRSSPGRGPPPGKCQPRQRAPPSSPPTACSCASPQLPEALARGCSWMSEAQRSDAPWRQNAYSPICT